MAFDFEKDNNDWNQKIDYGPTWPKGLMLFAAILLVLAIVLKFGMDFLTMRNQKTIDSLEIQIAQEKNNFPIQNQKAIIDFQRGVKNVKSILANKISSSYFLANIAANTHKEIYFNYLNSSVDEKAIEIGGFAKNNSAIVQAVEAFKQIEGVASVTIGSTRVFGTGVSFVISLNVDESFYR